MAQGPMIRVAAIQIAPDLESGSGTLERVLNAISRRAAFHSEDEYRLADRRKLAVQGDWTSHPVVRDAEAAISSTRRLIRLARKTGKRIHVLHVTTGEEMEMLAANKDIATCEVTPQHLTLVGPDDYVRLKGYAQMNPPIRDAHHRAALWAAVNQGIPDVLGRDRARFLRNWPEGGVLRRGMDAALPPA